MFDRPHGLTWSLPLGRLFGAQLRVSVLFFVVAGVLLFQRPWQIALLFTAALFVLALIRQAVQHLVARSTGGYADEMLMWPLGGLTAANPGPSTSSQVWTIAAGSLTSLSLCGLFFPGWYAPALLWQSLDPTQFPVKTFAATTFGRDVSLLLFFAAWWQFLLGLLPMLPFDGGRTVQGIVQHTLPDSPRLTAALGIIGAWIVLAVGLAGQWPWLMAVGVVVLLINALQGPFPSTSDSLDDSFMGYDFSQGYTSLERSDLSPADSAKSGWYARWKEQRRIEQETRAERRKQELEIQLDELLAKVHEGGLASLTEPEKRLLKRASEELRGRTRKPT